LSGRSESILVLAGHAPSLTNFRGPLLKAMRQNGHCVIAAAPDLEHSAVAEELRDLDVRPAEVPLRRTGLNPVADLRLVFHLARLMRASHATVFLGYTVKPVIFGLVAASLAGVPRRYALITGLGYGFAEGGFKVRLIGGIQKCLYRLALRQASKVFFQNRDDPMLFREVGLVPRDTPIVIVNGSGVDLERFRQAPLPPGPVRFLLIARMIAAKGVREYARAAALIRQLHPDVEFHLVGGLDSNPDALTQAELSSWQADRILVWHGEVDDVMPHIEAAHVYVLPSYYREGTPRSILEAMAVGRPVITTDAPGCRETVVDGENGFLVPPRDALRLAAAMERFVERPGIIEIMARRSRARAEEKYDVNKVNAQMLREMELA